MPSLSEKIYNLVDNYTDETEQKITNSDIITASGSLIDTLVSAHNAGDLIGSYTYYSDISTNPNDTTLGINAIKESGLRGKIRATNCVFNFKNTVNSKYIIVYNRKCFLYSTESDFDDTIESFNWKLGATAYSDADIVAQYNSSLDSIMNNKNNHL
ncbi:MAG: hypothetical protein Unbinned5179contig1000_20 [Prokaryotic dsDNA virus sp.]|nr:MAG: hypothetical protein Unbinned5179contig1000_20 [Prokaryotic dsDNA virus sp.]|tara:strand:+ start:1002 stop:1469 length:468 start_codon:yes stop_codon:yes gene_type:complete